MNIRLTTLGCLTALAASACVTPSTLSVSETDEPIRFFGFVARSGDNVVLEALNKKTGEWEGFATVQAETFPVALSTVYKNASAFPGVSLYRWEATAAISNPEIVGTLCRWQQNCSPGFGATATVRARAQHSIFGWSAVLAAAAPNWLDCGLTKVNAGEAPDILTAFWQCRVNDAGHLTVRLEPGITIGIGVARR